MFFGWCLLVPMKGVIKKMGMTVILIFLTLAYVLEILKNTKLKRENEELRQQRFELLKDDLKNE